MTETTPAAPPNFSKRVSAYVRSDSVSTVLYRGSNGHIYELARQGQDWVLSDLSAAAKAPEAAAAAGGPFGYVRADKVSMVLYCGSNGHIYVLYLQLGGTWKWADLSDAAKAPPDAAAVGDPCGYVRADDVSMVLYRGSKGHIYVLYLQLGSAWKWADLSDAAKVPPDAVAAGDPFGYVRLDKDGTKVSTVVYPGSKGHIYELYLKGGWKWTDLSDAAKAPPDAAAAGDPFGYVRSDKIPMVLYRGSNNHTYTLSLEKTGWMLTDFNKTYRAPAAAGDPVGYVRSDNISTVVYCGSNCHIYELALQSQGWIVSSLSRFCNGRDIPTCTTMQADVCVIGGGPAGISAAWKLGAAGLKVILLDGSRQLNYPPPLGTGNSCYFKDSWSDKEKLYKGVATGIFRDNDESDFLIVPASADDYTPPCDQRWGPFKPWERERVFGGTATHGGGQCRPQDPVDIEGRDYLGRTIFPAWPIPLGELEEAYRETSVVNNLFGNYPDNFTTKFWEKTIGLTNAMPKLDGFDVEMYQWMGNDWKNFATRLWGESRQTIDHFAQVIVNATVLNIAVQNGKVDHLEVASMEDYYPNQPMKPENPTQATSFKIKADIYILACGAVENARQLLLSEIGDKKLVGHYFMCHPLSRGDVITTTRGYLLPDQLYFMDGRDKAGKKWEGSPGSSLEGRFITNPKFTREKAIGRCWFWASSGGDAKMYFEMAPNYESCVGLDEDGPRDPVFGQKRTKIHWCLDDITDRRTYEENCREFKQNVAALPLKGEIDYWPWEKISNQWVPNGHHMGTTRMSVKPEDGVVDENLKVHGVDNLYVAGSSVFPSGGISNPTMTIVALSLRLAGHVGRRLGKP